MAGGEISEPTYLRVRVSHDGALPSAASPLGWLPGRFFDPRQSAGGVAIDFGAHPLYLAAHLLGMPEEVKAVYSRFTGRAVEDHSVVTMLYPNEVIGVAEASFLGASAPFCVETHTAPKEASSTTLAAASGRVARARTDGAPSGYPQTDGRPSSGG